MDTVERFFAEVKDKGHEPSLHRISGTIRYEITNGASNNGTSNNGSDQWTVTIDNGDLSVAHRGGRADTVLRTDRKLFERIVTGRANAMASTLRGLAFVEGDPELAVLSTRLFVTNLMRGGRHA